MNLQQAHHEVQQKQAVLVDVREADELKETGMAEGALWMPTSKMGGDCDTWADFKASLPRDQTIYVYCRSGNRSGRVAEMLCGCGYRAENLGGFKDWQAAGLPTTPFAG